MQILRMNNETTRYFIYKMSNITYISMFNGSESTKLILCPIQILKNAD